MENPNRVKKIEIRPNGTRRVYTVNEEPSMTDQSQAKQCDVNEIISKWNKTGELTHLKANQGVYADVSEFTDLHTAMHEVRLAEQAFLTIPAELRARFQNDPVQFVQFLNDPANDPEAIKLGLKNPPSGPIKVTFDGQRAGEAGSTSTRTGKNAQKSQTKKAQNDDDSNDDE